MLERMLKLDKQPSLRPVVKGISPLPPSDSLGCVPWGFLPRCSNDRTQFSPEAD